MHRPQAFTGDFNRITIGADDNDFARRCLQYYGSEDVAIVRVLGQYFVNGVVALLAGFGQGDEFFGAPVVLALFVIHDAAAQRVVGHFLVAGDQGGVDIQATGIGFVAILRKYQLAGHFGHVFGMHLVVRIARANVQLFGTRLLGLRLGDKAVLLHAVNDVLLPDFGTLGVADRIVGRWCLGEACEHGGFRHRNIFERLAKIGL